MYKKRLITVSFVAMLCLVFSVPYSFAAGNIRGNHLVDVEFVASKINNKDFVIVDGRDAGDYAKGHIPGAVNYGRKIVEVLKNPHDGQVKSPAELAELLGQIGVSNDKALIVYGTRADFHVLTEMSPVYVGLEKYYYLDGGYEDWVDARQKVETKLNTPKATTYKVTKINKDMYISTQELEKIVNNGAEGYTIIDVRSPQEYNADWVQATRGGHIPGAIHIPHSANLNKDGRFKSISELQEVYKDVPKGNKIVFYCHRGCRTAYTYMALELLGYDAQNYEEGWIVWGNKLDTPVENEHWRNDRGVDKKVADILKRLDALEKQSTAMASSPVAPPPAAPGYK